MFQYKISDENAMLNFGSALADVSVPGAIIFLIGDLGSGKTTLTRGFLRELGHAGIVKSPTYTLVEPYLMEFANIYHFDFYRIENPRELEYMGIRDYFDGQSICLIEWPERGYQILPTADLICKIEIEGDGRRVSVDAQSERGETILQDLQLQLAEKSSVK